eukprot:NODE_539_length_6273_cov_0.700194.p2 type:complete len:308 gc:universal NODE_539_length_6273_cov_0.700194:4916-3993(-)
MSQLHRRKGDSSVFYSIEDTVEHAYEQVEQVYEQAKETVQKVFNFADMPHYIQDNPFILTGYRICKTYKDSWMSMLYWHNETMNIWTHLIPALIFCGLIGHIWINWTEPISDKWMFTLYCICAIKCFSMSSLYHLHCHQTYKTYRLFSCLDYAGISVMIMGSCILMTYYVYYCNTTMQYIWQTLLIITSFVGIFGPFFDKFANHPTLRTICYIISGTFSGLPVGIHIFTHYSVPFHDDGIFFFIGMLVCYVGGAAIYVYQVPERFAPGRFDYLFHSHQIWHVFVFVASVMFYCSSLDMMMWREQNQC